MYIEPWIRLTEDGENTCTSDDIVAFSWKTPQPETTVTSSTTGALIVEFTRRRTDNAVYRYDDVERAVYTRLRAAARTKDAEGFDEFFNRNVRNGSAGESYTRQSRA